jgi:hypothetical protein
MTQFPEESDRHCCDALGYRGEMTRQISYNAASGIFTSVLGIGPSRTLVTVEAGSLQVRMGWAFRCEIPLAEIASAHLVEKTNWWWGIGAHRIGTNRWIMNGTLHDLVEIRMANTVRARTAGIAVKVDSLLVSVADPQALIAELK